MQLDPSQQVVEQHEEGALLVLAGPGAGKTASITARTARFINKGDDPKNLLCVTFSKKSANEMRERLALSTDEAAAERASIHTFHALGDRLIKLDPSACGREHGYTILDEADQRGLFTRVLKDRMNVEKPGKYDYRSWMSAYSRMGQDGICALDPKQIQMFSDGLHKHLGIDKEEQVRYLWHAFNQFEQAKKEQNVVDFNDLLILPYLALHSTPGFSKSIANEYQTITVDEAQDTSLVQYNLIYEIGKWHKNVTLVGDDDQSIYAWRGAHTDNLRKFIKNFDPKIHKLERNYRSTSRLVAASASHVAHNQKRLSKRPFSIRDESGAPGFHSSNSDQEMTRKLISMLRAHHDAGTPWSDQAILYRKNKIGESLEPALTHAGIPYEIQGGTKLTERKEVKLALSLARLVNNPKDQSAFIALAKGIKGLGDTRISQHIALAKELNEGNLLFESMPLKKLENVRLSMIELKTLCEDLTDAGPTYLIDALISRWKLDTYFTDEKPEQIEIRESRLRVFEQWIHMALDKIGADDNPWSLLQKSLIEDPETDLSEGGKVVLSTVHRSKGLEWPVVHIAGYSDGLMPLRNKAGEIENPEEERNISYVGMTRAANELYLHHCDRLFLGYETLELLPSPYLTEFEHEVMGQKQLKPDMPATSFMDSSAEDEPQAAGLPAWAQHQM